MIKLSKFRDLKISGKIKVIEFFENYSCIMTIAVMEIEKLSFSDQRIAKAISYIKVQTSLSEKFIIKRMKRLKKIFDSME